MTNAAKVTLFIQWASNGYYITNIDAAAVDGPFRTLAEAQEHYEDALVLSSAAEKAEKENILVYEGAGDAQE